MTLKQKKAVQALPSCNNNYKKAMLSAGYSPSTASSGHNIANVRKCAAALDFFSPKQITQDMLEHRRECQQAKDRTNVCRIDETRVRVARMVDDTPATSINIFSDEVINRLRVVTGIEVEKQVTDTSTMPASAIPSPKVERLEVEPSPTITPDNDDVNGSNTQSIDINKDMNDNS